MSGFVRWPVPQAPGGLGGISRLVQPPTVAPVCVADPVGSGTPQVGQTLSTTTGDWTGMPAPTFSYQWQYHDGSSWQFIVGANSSTWLVDVAQDGYFVRCRVEGTNSAGTAFATTDTLGPVTSGTDATVNAVIAAVAADAPAGTIEAGSDVTAAISDVAVSAPPANNIISVVINAPAAVAFVSAPAGVVTGGSADSTVTAAPATVRVSAPAASVSADASVTAAVSDTAVIAPAGAVSAGADVAGSVADVTVQALRPTITPAPSGGGDIISLAATFAEDSV